MVAKMIITHRFRCRPCRWINYSVVVLFLDCHCSTVL